MLNICEKKIILKDDDGKSVEVKLIQFIDHINHYHRSGTSIHDEKGHYFTVNEKFRNKLKKISEKR